MKQDLDSLKREIEAHLGETSFGVFHARSREAMDMDVHWDIEGHPDFHEYLTTAERAGVKLICLRSRVFEDMVEEAIEALEACEMSRDDHRTFERRLREYRGYEGFTCEVELSFDVSGMTYYFSKRAPWFDEFLDLAEDLELLSGGPDGGDDESEIGGYFSRN